MGFADTGKMKKLEKITLSLFMLIAATGCGGSSPRGTQPTVAIGQPAPPFTLELLDGRTATLDTYKGKPLVIINMASWCPCSHESAPVFKDIYEKYHPKGVEFLMIGIQDSRSKFAKFVKKKEFQFPAGFDKGDRISRIYGVSAPPTTFFINAEGKVVSAFYGKIVDRDKLSAWVDEIITKEGGQ